MNDTSLRAEPVSSHAQLADQLIAVANSKKKDDQAAFSAYHRFVEQYYAHVALQDLNLYPIEVLYGKVRSMWNWLHTRARDEAKVRVYRPDVETDGWETRTTLVEVVTRDMPFVVDSIHMALSKLGYSVMFTVNIGGLGVKRSKRNVSEIYSIGHVEAGSDLEAVLQMELDHTLGKEECDQLTKALTAVLSDVKLAVSDWQAMVQEARVAADELGQCPGKLTVERQHESIAFIDWLCDDNFTFLGCRSYDVRDEKILQLKPNSSLGVLRDKSLFQKNKAYADMPVRARELALSTESVVLIRKTNKESTVHRPGKTDCVIVKRFNKKGKVIGQRIFIGLFTSMANHASPREIPILRRKVSAVLERSGFLPTSHAGKALVHILDTLPRDDLFQASVNEINALAHGILHLQDRSVVRLFIQKDVYERYYSCLVYMPTEVFNTDLLRRIQQLFANYFKTTEIVYSVHFSNEVSARIHFVVTLSAESDKKKCDIEFLEHEVIILCRSWVMEFRKAVSAAYPEHKEAKALIEEYAKAFPVSYREYFTPEEAVDDVRLMRKLEKDRDFQMLFTQTEEGGRMLDLKLFRLGHTVPLSDVLPILENMGMRVIGEQPYHLNFGDGRSIWVNHFTMESLHGPVRLPEIAADMEEMFQRVWYGYIENDSFNQLIVLTSLSCSDVVALRSYACYLRQLNIPFSQAYIASAFLANPTMAELLSSYFRTKFDPSFVQEHRDKQLRQLERQIRHALEGVKSLDHDRTFSHYLNLMQATLRTNHFVPEENKPFRDYSAFKIAVKLIKDIALPKPLPEFDIFVRSCFHSFEGVHLRASKVARGGIRLSDRIHDYRMEAFDLQSAQQNKNAIIVPSGAKGAFVLTSNPPGLSRQEAMARVINAYQYFIRGLLDMVDNLDDSGTVVRRNGIIRYDDDDQYMVVAADKGTATFSDVANEISHSYGYWLGDAFASGGSTGYDHKRMGITAKGAWMAVEHHFRQMGIHVAKDEFTVVGIGDMGGDVFGNGMLLSNKIRLKAAFNHIHIFLDPEPDSQVSFEERQRLFKSPKFSWRDYDPKKISAGGGVYDRSAKSIPLSPEVQAWLGVDKEAMVPNDLIRLLLTANVDLIWNGGIGTFVRASDETDQDVADSANNPIRVVGKALRARVVAEGGNLGFSQRGRIEYALNGGVINTDFIDNSAGVDCSDHEVNIKILLNSVMAAGKLTLKQRNALLVKMSDEVAELVLAHNVKQNSSISLAVSESLKYLNLYQRYLAEQEDKGVLNRVVANLPSDKEIMQRKSQGVGLTRPEVAVLMAHTKNQLREYILASDLLDNEYLSSYVEHAFPRLLRTRYRDFMDRHYLRRVIIATQISNSIVNDMGGTFIHQMQDETGAEVKDIILAYVIAKEVYQMDQLMSEITLLNYSIPASLQAEMMQDVIRLIRRAARWFLRNRNQFDDLNEIIVQFSSDVKTLSKRLPRHLAGPGKESYRRFKSLMVAARVPETIAEKIACLTSKYSLLNIIEAASQTKHSLSTVASTYWVVSDYLQLDWLRERINDFPVDDRWSVLARATVKGELDVNLRLLTVSILTGGKQVKAADRRLQLWLQEHGPKADRWLRVIQQLRNSERHDFAMLAVVSQELSTLAKGCMHHESVSNS